MWQFLSKQNIILIGNRDDNWARVKNFTCKRGKLRMNLGEIKYSKNLRLLLLPGRALDKPQNKLNTLKCHGAHFEIFDF